jgi:hypothetical protein
LLEPIHDTELELLGSDRLDDVVTRTESKCSSEYINIALPTQDYDRYPCISFTDHLYGRISPWLSSISWELEIRDDDIIGVDEMDLSSELERWVDHADPIGA